MAWQPGAGRAPERILAVQLRRIGDVVMTTPALDAIRNVWPGVKLHLLTSDPSPDLFVGDSRLNVLWRRPPRRGLLELGRALRSEAFDLCLDFQSLPWTAILARSTGAYTVGFAKRYRRAAYHTAIRLEDHRGTDYAADHKLDLVRAIGLDPELVLPRLAPPHPHETIWLPAGERPRVIVVPVSLRPHKRWSASAFADTAVRVHRETGAYVLVAGGPGEDAPLAEVAAGMSAVPHAVHTFAGLGEFSSAIRRGRSVLGQRQRAASSRRGPRRSQPRLFRNAEPHSLDPARDVPPCGGLGYPACGRTPCT